MKDYLSPISGFHVPFYDALRNYEWVDEFVDIQRIKNQIKELRREKVQISKEIPSKQEFLQRAKKSFDEFRQRRLAWLANKIQVGLGKSKNPFGRIEYLNNSSGAYRLGPVLTMEDIETAADMVQWPEDTITAKQRKEKVGSLMDQIADLESELLKKTSSYYIVNGAVVTMDAREKFVEFWRGKQNQCREKVGPRGIALTESETEEQIAYEKLDIALWINDKSTRYAAIVVN